MSATVTHRVSLKRFLFIVVLALAGSAVLVPGAVAGNFDEQRMGCAGEDPATCPTGTEFQAYTMPIELLGDEDEICAVYTVASGQLPPGLSVRSDEAKITGTPTRAGTYEFYLNVAYNRETSCQFKNPSDDRFVIRINPGTPPPPSLPKLTIGPETTLPATRGTSYTLAMTASLADSKTWSIASGALPPGLTLNPSSGLISGSPSAAGSFFFTIQAFINPQQTDTKTLGIHVREPVSITASAGLDDEASRLARTEVGVAFEESLVVAGGLGPYTYTVTGELPEGIDYDQTTGELIGRAEVAGTYRFGVAVVDAEGRRDSFAARILVAERLAIVTKSLPKGKVGKRYRARLKAVGGVPEVSWRIKRGPLPRGIRFDRLTGTFQGTPTKAGRWLVTVELRDELGVKARTNVVISIGLAPKLRKR
jgi:Putative Ig domain